MKSISTKLSIAMVCCTLSAAMLVSVININTIKDVNKRDSEEILQLTCEKNVEALDAQLLRIEQSVELLAQHALTYLENPLLEAVPEHRMKKFEEVCVSTAEFTDETATVYFHYNPEKYSPSNDFLYVKSPGKNVYVDMEADDPRTFEKETGERANWYFAAAESKEPAWLDPCYNTALKGYEDIPLSSYTVPVIGTDNQLIGVVGMDFSLDTIVDFTSSIDAYDSGYAFLLGSNMEIVYHPDIEFGSELKIEGKVPELEVVLQELKEGHPQNEFYEYVYRNKEKKLYFSILRNGLRLAVTVPSEEVYQSVHEMIGETYLLLSIVIIASVMIIFCIVYSYIRPLLLLDKATTQIINGNMSVEINYYANDEIGSLSENFRKMVAFLQEHISYINQMAYCDAMTGVKNKAAYENALNKLRTRISQGFTGFGVAVFDLNNLKTVNDSMGHEAGDILIKNASYVICKAFTHSPVFRIGGDEFAVILENDDYIHRDECVEKMKKINSDLNKTLPDAEKVSFAFGIACFDAEKDDDYSTVFERADKAMYENKVAMKKGQAPR